MAARRRNAESSSADSSSFLSPTPGKIGTMLFARTSSGSFEVAKIIEMDSFDECCYALFEDGKKHWVPFANMQKKDLTVVLNVCCLCQRKARSPKKPLLKCISCQLGFHRKCHSPFVHRLDPEEVARWQCQICIYASSSSVCSDVILSRPSEENRSKQLSKAAESSNDRDVDSDNELRVRRQKKLSYSFASLTWDKNHLTNSENSYCYCGRSGRWDDDMLRCTRCLQWFHRGCISMKTDALVAGDLLYVFFCSICFKEEFYYRLQVTWMDLAHLSLYNLSREQADLEFFDFEWDIVPWVRRHWRNFHAGKLNGVAQKEREKNLLEALEKNPSRFEPSHPPKTGWHLKEKKILTAPDIDLGRFQSPPGRLQMERLLRTSSTPVKGCDDLEEKQTRKRKKQKADTKSKRQKQKKLKSDTSEPATSEPTSSSSADKSQSSLINRPTTSKRTEARRGVLEKIIPAPVSYDGVNHPFKTEIEKEDDMKTLECQRETLKLAMCKIVAQLAASADSTLADTKNKEQDGASTVRSVTGELFNFNGVDVANRPKRRKNFLKKNVTDPFLDDHSEDGLEGVTIRYFGPNNMRGRVIGKRTIEGSNHQLLVEWRDADRT